MAAEIKEKTGVEAELIAAGGGVFEVEVDGTLIFSKKAEDRFPESDEIFASIAELS